MRISWHSNAPWARSGYGNQTALFVPRLQALGYEMSIQASYGLKGGIIQWNGIPIMSNAIEQYGQDIIAANAAAMKADIVLSLLDAWVYEPAKHLHGMRWVPWFPVDMEPIPPIVVEKVAQSYQGIVYSKFGQREAGRAGLDVRYVPHGVDTKVYAPLTNAREATLLPKDRFIVGMVAANIGKPARKAWEPNLRAFRAFQLKHTDALLYLHTNMGQELDGLNLTELLHILGMVAGKDYIAIDGFQHHIGFSDDKMAAFYNSFDVLLACSMGEGFGIPILEAQACGTPVITGDWTAMSELTWRGLAVPKSEADPWYTPLASYQFQPRAGAITDALEQVYAKTWVRHVPQQVAEYDADVVTQTYWRPVLAEIAERIGVEQAVAVHPNGAHEPEQVAA